jgi:quinol monooxygenase YgiN
MLSRPSIISYLLVSISIDPKDLPTFIPALKECYLNVITEPDCFLFQVLYDEKQPGVFKFIEGWARDKEWLLDVSPETTHEGARKAY